MMRRTTLLLLLALAANMPLAQVYKWVDENGVVNYGDKPPARNKSAQPLTENGGSVSVVPGIPKDEMERLRAQDMQRRVQQLEREVDELRVRAAAHDQPAPYPVPADVYVPGYAYGYGYGYGYPRRPLYPGAGRPGPRPEHPIANTGRSRSSRHSPIEPVRGSVPMRGGRG